MRTQLTLAVAGGLWLLGGGGLRADEKADQDKLKDTLVAQEKRAWDAMRRGNADALNELLAPKYRQVGWPVDGRQERAEVLKSVTDLRVTDYSLDNFEATALGADGAVLTYTARLEGSFGRQLLPPATYAVSSAWVKRDGKWLSELRQWTLVPPKKAPRTVLKAFEMALTDEGLRCAYRGSTRLEDVRVQVTLAFRDGGRITHGDQYWAAWQPGDFKDVSLRFLARTPDQIERIDLSGTATMDGKPVTLSASSRRQK